MYATVSNPLLQSNIKTSPPRRSLSKSMAQKWSESRVGQMMTSSKRVVPSQSHTSLNHHHDVKYVPSPKLNDKGGNNNGITQSERTLNHTALSSKPAIDHHILHQGPHVYYNGPIEKLIDFPQDRLTWLLKPSAVEEHLPQWASPSLVALRKPHVIDHSSHRMASNPMAMLYLRVLDVVKSTSAKASSFQCKIQIRDQVYHGAPTPCVKYEKQSSQAEMDEVYIFDMDQPTTVTFELYMKTKIPLLKGGRRRSMEICLGQKEYHLPLRSVEKQLNRITFQHGQDTYQVMLIHGLFMSDRAQSIIANQFLHCDFLTVYRRGCTIPRWHRYWGVLRATQLELYDFEYKESKPAQVVLSFHMLEKVFHPSNADDDEQIDVGTLGLALQFTPYHRHINSLSGVVENVMYVLPDNAPSGLEWENSFSHCASLMEEFRPAASQTYDTSTSIPAKYLW